MISGNGEEREGKETKLKIKHISRYLLIFNLKM